MLQPSTPNPTSNRNLHQTSNTQHVADWIDKFLNMKMDQSQSHSLSCKGLQAIQRWRRINHANGSCVCNENQITPAAEDIETVATCTVEVNVPTNTNGEASDHTKYLDLTAQSHHDVLRLFWDRLLIAHQQVQQPRASHSFVLQYVFQTSSGKI